MFSRNDWGVPRSEGWKSAVDKKTQVECCFFSFMTPVPQQSQVLSVGGMLEDDGSV